MKLLTKRLLQTVCVGACVFTFVFVPTRTDAQGGCPKHRGTNGGGSPGMMGGMGGGMGSQQGMMGPMGKGMGGMGGQSNMAQQKGMMADMHTDQNDPAAVLAHKDDLSLTKEQVQRLERMIKSGKKHAAPLLNKEQKKKFQELAGTQDSARAKQHPMMKPDAAKAKPPTISDSSAN